MANQTPTIPLDPLLEEITPTRPAPSTRSSPRKQSQAKSNNQPSSPTKTKDVKVVKPESKKKNPNWSIEEDKQLCVAWLNTSRDAIVGTGQKASTFWECVHKLYTELVEDLNSESKRNKKFKPLPIRLVNAVECRWGHIVKVCNKFGGIYSQVERRLTSGRSRDDILSEAKELFKETHESTFNLDHCWGILKDTPKWQATQIENDLRMKKNKEPPAPKETSSIPPTDETQPSSPQANGRANDDEEAEPERSILGSDRPDGQKAAKRKRTEDMMLKKVLKTQEELVQISKERMKSVKAAMQSASDDRIMSMDLSAMDEESRAYWQKKKRAILDRPE